MNVMSDLTFLLLLTQLVTCSFMTGLIWTIQVLHYPAFAFVSNERFLNFHEFHTRNISFIVMPIMILELATAILLSVRTPHPPLLVVNALALIVIWLVTFFVSVPLHNALSKQMGTEEIKKLVLTNWARTLLWSLRLMILIYFVFAHIEIRLA